MILVYSSQNTLLVDNARNALENEGIACTVKNRQLGGAAGEVPPIEAWLELWVVDDGDAPKAKELIEATTAPSHSGAPWRCDTCAEEIPAEIGSCWNCAAASEEPPAREPMPGGLLYRAASRRMGVSDRFSWLAMAAMIAALLYMLLSG